MKLQLSYEAWLISCNEDASKEIFVAIGILVFGFELSIGESCDVRLRTSDDP
ncbi:MAG: hypothetical protein ISS76_21605 [Phycisphaerae bacterium]|nr:hypothetical protein [Phycisphaerae bacterium]